MYADGGGVPVTLFLVGVLDCDAEDAEAEPPPTCVAAAWQT
jgi:hypothetical protein